MISETHEAIIPSDAKRSRRIPRSHRKLSHRIGSGAFAPNALGLLCSLDLARNDVYIRRLMPDDISLTCPRCNVPLKEVRTSGGVFYGCDVCGGRAVTIELLRKRFTPESINLLWVYAMRGEGTHRPALSIVPAADDRRRLIRQSGNRCRCLPSLSFRPVRSPRNGHSCSACNATSRVQSICTKCTATFNVWFRWSCSGYRSF